MSTSLCFSHWSYANSRTTIKIHTRAIFHLFVFVLEKMSPLHSRTVGNPSCGKNNWHGGRSCGSDLLVGCHRPLGRCGCKGSWAESRVWRLSRVSWSRIACSRERRREREIEIERERERERERPHWSHTNSSHLHATLKQLITVLESTSHSVLPT